MRNSTPTIPGGIGPDPRALKAGRFNRDREGRVLEVILNGSTAGTNAAIFQFLRAYPPTGYDGKIRMPTVSYFTKRATEAGIIEARRVGGKTVYLPLADGPDFARATPSGLAFRKRILRDDSAKSTPATFDRSQWHSAVSSGMHRYAARNGTRLVQRKQLIAEELPQIAAEAGASGLTPDQTLSRVLQELRAAGHLHHIGRGVDLLLDQPLLVETEDLPDSALDAALERDQLRLGDVTTGSAQVLARRRRGQARLRVHALKNYGATCALCDVADPQLLVASHIVRWADDFVEQGRLANVLCLCQMHDALFETGYIALADDYTVISRASHCSGVIGYLQGTASSLRVPSSHAPLPEYLRRHRIRTGHQSSEGDSSPTA